MAITTPIDEHAALLDSRDIIARIAALQAVRTTADEQAELDALLALEEQASDCPDWEDGATLVADYYFPDHARELAEDADRLQQDWRSVWPLLCIDWDQAARELQQDYTAVEYAGQTFWIRA